MRSNPTYPGWTFDEGESLELGAELLAANSEADLDQFLSGVLRRAAGAVQRRLQPQVAQALGRLLKGAMHRLLPRTGRAMAWLRSSPGPGQLAEAAGRILGVEMEGLSPEDQELVAAQQMMQLAGAAAAQAATQPRTSAPDSAARQALARAAQTFAPGLLQPAVASGQSSGKRACGCGGHGGCTCHQAQTGRWEQRGRSIVLYGV